MRLTLSTTIGGKGISGTITREGTSEYATTNTLAAGKAGTLTTRTDDNTGVATLSAGHGIVTSDVVDVFWAGGLRRGMTATVAVNAVTVDGGAGTVLPAATTALVVCKQTVLDVDITGNTVVAAAVSSQRRGSVSIQQNDGTVIKDLDLGLSGEDGEAWVYASNLDVTNPFAAVSIGKVVISNGSSTGTSIVRTGFVLNN